MSEHSANVLVLVGSSRQASTLGCRLGEALQRSSGPGVDVTEDSRSLCHLSGRAVVVVAREAALHPEQADALAGFLREGGRVVALGDTLWHWRGHAVLSGGVEWPSRDRTPETEVRVRRLAGHPLTDRLRDEFRLSSRLRPLAHPPDGARLLLEAPWRFETQTVAFELAVGRGWLTHVGLDGERVAEDDDARRFLTRCVRHPAEEHTVALGVGLLGYGAIARTHAEAIGAVAGLALRGVVDPSEQRRQAAQAELDVPTHELTGALLDDRSIDVVVIGTPPNTHLACTLEALDAGKHVVCEKPLALTLRDADAMISRAGDSDRALTVYQNRRWDPDFVALHELVRMGGIGTVFHLEAFVGGHDHPCSYWHSHEAVSGGTLFDWGSHYVDQILQLLDATVVSVSARAQKRLWHDVTNADQVHLVISFEDGAEASFIHSDIAAARKPKWYLLGTQGAVVAEWRAPMLSDRNWAGELVESALPVADAPSRLVVHRPDGRGGAHREALSLPPRDRLGFYRNLADHLLTDEPLAVSHRDMHRVIGVLDAAAQSIARGGASITVSL